MHDPYPIKIESTRMFIDLGAEQMIAAEKAGGRIAVLLPHKYTLNFHKVYV